MDAFEYLRERDRMCKVYRDGCAGCPAGQGDCTELETNDPAGMIWIVQKWAEAHPVDGEYRLTAMERRFAVIYIEKGYLWAARDKDGELRLYKREPERRETVFINTSPVVKSSRAVLGGLFPWITWDNSPMCLPKLLEVGGK